MMTRCCIFLKTAQISISPYYLISFLTPFPLPAFPLSHTYAYMHIYHGPAHTKCKQRVMDRLLLSACTVCTLIPSAGPASPVHSVRDELLHGSSFFLPSPSPLWPSGHTGKTSLVNYLCVKTALATYHTAIHECERMSICVCVCKLLSAGMCAGALEWCSCQCISNSGFHHLTGGYSISFLVHSTRVCSNSACICTCCSSWFHQKLGNRAVEQDNSLHGCEIALSSSSVLHNKPAPCTSL